MKYILIAFTFFACTNISPNNDPLKISMEALDTIKVVPAQIDASPSLFETAFIKGTSQSVNNKSLNLYGVTIGKIKIVSGYIIACDPMHIDEYGIPFTQVFPMGEFPVQLSIAKLDGAETIAFARIKFSDEPVTNWEFALLEGQQRIPIEGKKKYGYSVDAGIGIFIDEEAKKSLDENQFANMDAPLYTELDKHYRNDWKYTMFEFGNHNLAAFTSGLGDGNYATYIGYDAKGIPCRLITDFGLFDWRGK